MNAAGARPLLAAAAISRPGLVALPSHSNPLSRRRPPALLPLRSLCNRLSGASAIVVATAVRREFLQLSEDSSQQVSMDRDGDDGPIELPSDLDPFAIPEVSPLQTAASVLLTGAIAFFLYRSLRRRSQRAKEVRFRSSGVESIKEQAKKAAIANLKLGPEVEVPPPSAVQTFLGALISGGIALLLYKFTTGVDGAFAGKAVSATYSIRQLTITVRTIISGLCYLATFVFAANSIGLTLYSLQLALNLAPTQPPSLRGKDDTNIDAKPVETAGSEENTEN